MNRPKSPKCICAKRAHTHTDCRSDELALNGVLVVLVARVFTDFVVAPRLTRAKRYAACPQQFAIGSKLGILYCV